MNECCAQRKEVETYCDASCRTSRSASRLKRFFDCELSRGFVIKAHVGGSAATLTTAEDWKEGVAWWYKRRVAPSARTVVLLDTATRRKSRVASCVE